MKQTDKKRSQSHEIAIDKELTLHVEVVGEGPALLCYSGFACSRYNFLPMASYLQNHFTLYLLDNRGFGRSGHVKQEYDFDQMADDGIKVMEHFGQTSYHVAGISMGGFIAQRHALLKPESIKSLHLLATKSSGPDYPVTGAVTEASFTQFYNMDPEIGNRFAIEAFVHPQFKGSSECERVIELRAKENPVDLNQALIQLRSSWKFLETPQPLEKINSPTLIIHGENDPFLIPDNARIMQRNIHHSQLEIIENCSHLFFFERPQLTAMKMASFVEAL
ncbi:MAG: alpha/beta hydrolase [Bdellovibrionales bacterium]|jgi:3-oxoadipate enol-lactonase|nr:alpha/beta hydrolase [Bdellovibrionales bacterium]MBT7670601.1 alpha/beta hydrolase [Bdellovibrionales bacterium]